jgi:hypothetical protein
MRISATYIPPGFSCHGFPYDKSSFAICRVTIPGILRNKITKWGKSDIFTSYKTSHAALWNYIYGIIHIVQYWSNYLLDFEILGFLSDSAEVFLLRYDIASLGKLFPTFRDNVVVFFKGLLCPMRNVQNNLDIYTLEDETTTLFSKRQEPVTKWQGVTAQKDEYPSS